mmetsp:Transcript_36629/g.80257  ORF Transcript_36629/g.80257 Transcript_36629/m.80257 type:complete len:288 (+) Transcript_36629:65-928(+)
MLAFACLAGPRPFMAPTGIAECSPSLEHARRACAGLAALSASVSCATAAVRLVRRKPRRSGTVRSGSCRDRGQLCGRSCLGRPEEVIGRAGLLRASWWSLPLGRRGPETSKSTSTLTLDTDIENGTSPEEELRLLSQTGPTRIAMLGTRECPFQHQQEIELLSEARVNRGDHIFTSGSSGTNSAVIEGALRAKRPHLLTVILPQSMRRQDSDSQLLLAKCHECGVDVRPMRGNDKLPLAEAARRCNSHVLSLVTKLVAFASHESSVYLDLIEEAKSNGILATPFFLD